jgi:DNA-binding CsgD family transcriptional regulator
MSNDEVSHLLGLSKNTVPVHVRNIYRKLGAKRRTEAVFEARHLGIVI